ncbi:MAG: hypothetical protein ACE5HO_03415 [bacterium]
MKEETLKALIKESVREVLKEERLVLYELLVPYVSSKELQEITKKYGSPEDYDEEKFIDMTHWIKK